MLPIVVIVCLDHAFVRDDTTSQAYLTYTASEYSTLLPVMYVSYQACACQSLPLTCMCGHQKVTTLNRGIEPTSDGYPTQACLQETNGECFDLTLCVFLCSQTSNR